MSTLKPKRSLGQNFINNKGIAEKIVSITLAQNPDQLVEIGPGTGVFTYLFSKYIQELNFKLHAIEKDDMLYTILEKNPLLGDVNFIHSDVFDVDLGKLLTGDNTRKVVFGSLPYNQSKKIINDLLKLDLFDDHFYIIQKEVAQKYTEEIPSNRLSLYSSLFSKKKMLFDIGPSNFTPRPNVMSTLIQFSRIEPLIASKEIPEFEKITKDAFKNPRKKLRNNLPSNKFDFENPKIKSLLEKRPSDLTLLDYIGLLNFVNQI